MKNLHISNYKEISLGIDFTALDIQHNLAENGLPWEKAKLLMDLH